jgi:hypothetical protein
MDSLKGIGKGGWHPGGSKSSSTPSSGSTGEKKSFTGLGVRGKLSDATGRVQGKDTESLKHREQALNHQSRPLASLQDPSSFAPPPKHSAYYDAGGRSLTAGSNSAAGSSQAVVRTEPVRQGGWGAPAVETGYAARKAAEQREREEQAEMEAETERQRRQQVGYLKDTSGLRTDNLPKPPVRRIATEEEGTTAPAVRRQSPALPGRTQSPALPARKQSPALPPRRAGAPPPSLPPRQNEYPDEHTPAPPPAYQDALRSPAVQNAAKKTYQQNSGAINQFAAQRLGNAGVSVPGFGIGGGGSSGSNSTANTSAQPAGHGPQLGELQQRFARMGTGASSSSTSGTQIGSASAAAAQKKPPPPPPKKATLSAGAGPSNAASSAPPPLPLSSKPKPPM